VNIGFWTVFKWAAAIVLAPIVVWLTIAILIASIAVCNAPPSSSNRSTPAVKRSHR
jgi:hypothetical protein